MTTGKQLAGLLLLSTALSFPGVALAQDTQGNANSQKQAEQDPDAVLQGVEGDTQEAVEDPVISIPGGAIIVTGRVNRDPTRNAAQVVSVLSTEQIARTGEGDIAGALGRVTGLSVVGDGRVYVRGLGDRYSLAMLNGLPLPSPEPLSRVVPLDIFPTNVVASSLVQKTYSPNFPGEFGGGVINLTTRAVPDESFLTISGGLSGDTETTFENGLAYYGAGTDWTGFDNGIRDMPPVLRNFIDNSIADGLTVGDLDQGGVEDLARVLLPSQMSTLQKIGDLRPNFSVGMTAGTAFDVGADGRLGIVLTGSLSNNYRNRVISRQEAGPNDTTLARDESNFVTDNNMLVNAMLGIGYEFGDHVIRLTNLFIRDTVKQASLANFKDFNEFPDADLQEQKTGWFERQLIDTQAVGEFDFGALSLDLRGGFARTDREAPYNLNYVYARTNDANDPFGNVYRVDLSGAGQQALQETGANVSFSDLYEELWFGGIDATYEITPVLSITAGYAYTDTDRYSQRRGFQLRADVDLDFLNPDGDPDIPSLPPEVLPALEYVLAAAGTRSPTYLFNSATFNLFDIELLDFNESDPAFSAELTINAGYGQLQWTPTPNLTIQGGVRYEDATQSTTPIGQLNLGTAVSRSESYWLPGATITWEAMDDLQLRISGSKTIARPQFRELVRQVYFDPETNRQFSGNPYLVDSELLNGEARAEYYLGGQSRVSLAGFYKEIDNPIEAYIFSVAGDQRVGYANAPKASIYGAEADFQYFMDLYDWGGWFETKQLVFLANYTYTSSELSVGDNDTVTVIVGENVIPGAQASSYFRDGARLVGQSDHLINLQLGLEDTDRLQQLTVLLSYASDRVSLRGFNTLPDVIEKPGVQLDLVARQGIDLFGADAEFKLEARNLLGTDHQEYQINSQGLRFENNSYDVGRRFSASLSITF
ncbi:outer membrane receptor protein involved in Fe transport [Altererythrobacter atlanticus]|nr:TonB-dependent receptor [Croceibacterium atlanticum]MBB5733607.1 outer membrane receptor protein involved in Fe transport [Croceibacterium atlanticum]